MGAVSAGFSAEYVGMHQRVGVNGGGEIVLQSAGEMKRILGRHVLDALEQGRIATPADFDASEKISLGTRHLEQPLRLERGLGAEDLGVGTEADFGAAAVIDLAEVLQLALGVAAFEAHAKELLAAGDLDLEPGGQRVHHRDAHAVQPARGLIDLGVELAAGMQRAHDDFERRLFRKFRMRIDRNAAAIVGHGEEAFGLEFDLDEARMPGQRLVHRVVDDFGEQMMQRLFVGAADIHAGAAADRLQALEHLDVGRGIAGLGAAGRGLGRGLCPYFRDAKQIACRFFLGV